jgi:membrane protein YdbS with pleckstrin-like domain
LKFGTNSQRAETEQARTPWRRRQGRQVGLRLGTGGASGIIAGPVLLIALALIIRVPSTRYNARGYQISADRLRVVRGLLFRFDTVVPFGRVQHIDVHQGPLDRFFGIATLTVHTAGNHNASVSLPGLGEPLAREMREDIRAHIRRETL